MFSQKKEISKHAISMLIITVIISFLCRNLIFKPGLPLGGDALWLFYSFDSYKQFNLWLSSWYFTGTSLFNQQFSPLVVLFSLPARYYPYILYLSGGILAYFVIYKYTENSLSSLVGSLIFVINQRVLSFLIPGHYAHLLGYALFPLVFLLFDRAIDTGKPRYIVIFAIFMFLYTMGSNLQEPYMSLLFLSLLCLFYIKNRKYNILKVSILSSVIVLGLMSYQLLPLLKMEVPTTYQGVFFNIEEAYKYSTESLLKATVMIIQDDIFKYIEENLITFVSGSIVPILAFSSLFFRRNRYTLFFSTIALISIFISKGPNPPLGGLFIWLWDNLPGFHTFRVASRWSVLLAFSYSFLVAITINEMLKLVKQNKPNDYLFKYNLHSVAPYILSVILIFSLINFSKLTIIEGYPSTFNPDEITPFNETNYAYNLIKMQENQDELFYILPASNFYFDTNPKDKRRSGAWKMPEPVRMNSIKSGMPLLSFPVGSSSERFLRFYPHNLARQQSTDQFMKILGALNVKYVALRKNMPKYYEPFFASQDGSEVFFEGNTVTMYKNQYSLPHIYAVESSIALVGGYDALTALMKVPNYNTSSVTVYYLDKDTYNFDKSDMLILYNQDYTDYLLYEMFLRKEEPVDVEKHALPPLIPLSKYLNKKTEEQWIVSPWWSESGEFTFDGFTVRTSGRNTLTIPVNIKESGEYDIWVRVGYGPDRGLLSIRVDGKDVLTLRPISSFYGLKNIRVERHLGKGKHIIEIENDGTGFNDIDEILLFKSENVLAEIKKISEFLQNNPTKFVYLFEAEKLYGPRLNDKLKIQILKRRSINTQVVCIEQEYPLSKELYIPENSSYVLSVRAAAYSPSTLKINIDGNSLESFDFHDKQDIREFKWFISAPFYLVAGNHEIELQPTGKTCLDIVMLYQKEEKKAENLGLFSSKQNTTEVVSYTRISPSKYHVKVRADKPFYLILAESYNPTWKASVGKEEIGSIPVYSLINGFYINKTGEFTINLEFTAQRYVKYGLVISLLTLITILGILMWDWRIKDN